MCLQQGMFSNLEIRSIQGKKIYLVDRHNYVFPIWASFIHNNGGHPRKLVTFDYHTDTRKAFCSYMSRVGKQRDIYTSEELEKIREERIRLINIDSIDSLISAADDLNNDEHIRLAYELGIISEYHVINCSATYCDENGYYYKNDLCYDTCPKRLGCKHECPPEFNQYKVSRLENIYLEDVNFNIPQGPIILDFDLDYFPCRSSFLPRNSSIISSIIKAADIITIAREENYFNSCKKQEFNVEEAQSLLLDFISKSLE